MEITAAVIAFSALAHPSRLAVFRLLVKAGPEGLKAGDIADTLGIPPASLSFHLKELASAGIARARAESRFVIYSANFTTMGALVGYLTDDCCAGHPEVCAPIRTAAFATPPRKHRVPEKNE